MHVRSLHNCSPSKDLNSFAFHCTSPTHSTPYHPNALDDLSVRLPPGSSLQRWLFPCDMAIMLQQRETLRNILRERGGLTLWRGADSSPQHHIDWLLSAYAYAAKHDVAEIWFAVKRLAHIPASNVTERREVASSLLKLHMHRQTAS